MNEQEPCHTGPAAHVCGACADQSLPPAVLAEDLRALAEHGRLDNATIDALNQAADWLDTLTAQ